MKPVFLSETYTQEDKQQKQVMQIRTQTLRTTGMCHTYHQY